MVDRSEQQDDPRLVAAARHALHDEEVVAAYAVDGDEAEDPAKARTLIERCETCRSIHTDLVVIGSTIRAAGTAEAVAATRRAPRDFRLTATEAVHLRGGNALQRTIARFRDGLAAFGRPVGASLAAMGVVGLLVGSAAIGQLGGAPAMEPGDAQGGLEGAATPAPAPMATRDGAGTLGSAYQSPASDRSNGGPAPSPEHEALTSSGTDDVRPAEIGTPLVFAGSIVLVVLGAALLLAGSRQRRLLPVRRSSSRSIRT